MTDTQRTIDSLLLEERSLLNEFYENASKIVCKFIKDNPKLIVFDKYAIRAFIQMNKNVKTPDIMSFDASDESAGKIIPIRVYSENGMDDAYKLIDELMKSNFKLVPPKLKPFVKSKSKTTNTWIVSSECRELVAFESLYGQQNAIDALLKTAIKYDGINYISPTIMKINIYKNLSNPRQGISLWKDSLQNLITLETQTHSIGRTPIIDMDDFPKYFSVYRPRDPKIERALRAVHANFIHNNKEVILIGLYAVLMYKILNSIDNSKVVDDIRITYFDDKKQFPFVNTFNVLSFNPKRDTDKIKGIILKLDANARFDVRVQRSPLRFHGAKFTIKYGDHVVADLYDVSEECIPYFAKNGVNIGSFYTVLRFLYVGVFIAKLSNTGELEKRMNASITYLLLLRSLSPANPIFRGLYVENGECLGQQKNQLREALIKKWDENAQKKSKITNEDGENEEEEPEREMPEPKNSKKNNKSKSNKKVKSI